MRRTIVMVAVLLAVSGCSSVDASDAKSQTQQSREATEADFASAESAIAMQGDVSRSWGVCMSSPTDGVEYSVVSSVEGEPVPLLDTLREKLEAAGWSVEQASDEGGLRTVVMIQDEASLTMGTFDKGVSWGITGECIRVPSDLAEDLLAE